MNVPWSRDEISGCDCNEKMYRHVHCPCLACKGRATVRKTELRHWNETCQFTATNSASVVSNDSDNDSHISDDIFLKMLENVTNQQKTHMEQVVILN